MTNTPIKAGVIADTLYRRLFSTKTLVRVAFATLSLHNTGTAFGRGLPIGTQPPVHGTTWAAMREQSHKGEAQDKAIDAITGLHQFRIRLSDTSVISRLATNLY
jgi:hypothetical protein